MEKITLNVGEAAELLGVSRPTIYRLMRRSDFPVLHIGRRTLVHGERLKAWAERQAEGGEQE